jgi:hypothetical protein
MYFSLAGLFFRPGVSSRYKRGFSPRTLGHSPRATRHSYNLSNTRKRLDISHRSMLSSPMFAALQFGPRRNPLRDPRHPLTPTALNLRRASRIPDVHRDATETRPETFCFQIIDKRVRNSLNKWTFKSLYFANDAHSLAASPVFSMLSQKHPLYSFRPIIPTEASSRRATTQVPRNQKLPARPGPKSQTHQRVRRACSHPIRSALRTTVALTRRPSNDILNQQKSAAVPSASFRKMQTCDAST